ncbi:HAD family hydrolase [Denitrificimonas caeni]|uniref:HAD-IA family hydrolase n=1 Tax=Denitrificimonas caeni TaxID=521720 RepID=A0AAE9VPI0_9GAMM|nr:HAD-IA family hydrolase [Denitrificimonas caeni]WBE25068.1 HAD-IA family hydrolase [Denitrificimonas caeni]
MKLQVSDYATLVFDCDGVILNSNQVKTDAFYQAALPYGEAAAQALIDYHVANGGVSRYLKFGYFLEQLVPKFAPNDAGPSLDELLENYAKAVLQGLLSCEVALGLKELRAATPNARWLIVSGGDQSELRKVFAQRDLAALFDSGIYGSPDTKDEILSRELQNGNIQAPALFIGDSKYDQKAAATARLDFVFLSKWSEVKGWKEWIAREKLCTRASINALADPGIIK